MPVDAGLSKFGKRAVGEIAASLPGATAVFRAFKLDFCCGGESKLEDAATKRGLDPSIVERELEALATTRPQVQSAQDTVTMIGEILHRYHEVHRRELPELIKLARKVEAVHADHTAVPHGLADTLQYMIGELEVHIKKEELILFPAMLRNTSHPLSAPIAQMRHDHNDHGVRLRQLDELTNGFSLPEGACRSWQALYAGTRKLADDLVEHIHLENYVLFPRFERAQRKIGTPSQTLVVAFPPYAKPPTAAPSLSSSEALYSKSINTERQCPMTDKSSSRDKIATYAADADSGSTLLPMLIGGLVMIVFGMAIVMAFV